MNGFNRVILAGNLTRDPELRYTPKGTAVAKIGLAINRTYTAENGERKEEVNFVDVEAWSKQAEVIAQYLRKGSPILMEGRLKLDTWEDKNTHQKLSKLKVVLESFNFIGAGRGDASSPEAQPARPRPAAAAPASAPAAAAPPAEPETAPPDEDDVPF